MHEKCPVLLCGEVMHAKVPDTFCTRPARGSEPHMEVRRRLLLKDALALTEALELGTGVTYKEEDDLTLQNRFSPVLGSDPGNNARKGAGHLL